MAYNLEKKIKEFEFERKQVLHHLALLDANIATLKCAIDLMQQENDITLYNTQNFVYRRKFKLFKGKIRKYLVQILRNEPSKGFTIADLTQRILRLNKIKRHLPKNILILFVNSSTNFTKGIGSPEHKSAVERCFGNGEQNSGIPPLFLLSFVLYLF
ncbi:DNA repair ATPase [Rodentibacter pneumotropicus]|uniref:DNA repair ATPase n=1 Tax=Rodentibacter pneumotropicus TaxID=758 RepID=A0A3S5ES31_9PAST|nr:DNA repair ATPase [Rodentibacter pneumotropicus]